MDFAAVHKPADFVIVRNPADSVEERSPADFVVAVDVGRMNRSKMAVDVVVEEVMSMDIPQLEA
jgi:hypothetical protein